MKLNKRLPCDTMALSGAHGSFAEYITSAEFRKIIFSRDIEMVKILFLCHGNICRSPMA
ncbi:MAG TPA: hypothetical protein DIT87_01405, partial [Clostridiales bacterium]|nr:hypothetical protein [Clostridiales bacterium]